MVSPSLGILLGPVTLLWAILATTTSMDPGTQTLFTMALTGGFGTVMYTFVVLLSLASLDNHVSIQ